MLTDVAIWSPPSPPVQSGSRAVLVIPSQVAGHPAFQGLTDADYVPVETYLKTGRSLRRSPRSGVAVVATATGHAGEMPTGAGSRARAAIELYTSIFNYGSQPASALSIMA